MRKILCIVLAFAICNVSILSYVYAEDNEKNIQNTTNQTSEDLQTQQEKLQNQINEATGQLEDVQNELSENLQQVQKLDEQIKNSQEELNELNTKITELQTSIDEVSVKLKESEESFEKQQAVLEKRLVAVYEAGETNYLDVILSSRTISDFLSNYFLITEIASYDMELLEELENKKDEIEKEKEKLEKNQKELATIKINQTRTAKILENTKTVRENMMSRLSNEEKEIQSQIDEYNRQFEEINAQILELALQGIDTKYIGGVLAWPVPGYTRVTSSFGMRTHPITGIYKLHTGVDIGAPSGANFVSANDGIVVMAGYNSAYGNMVIIDHGGGVQTLYAHGSEILVNVGDTVKKGETVVLKVGSTGYSTGPHAHFEVRLNGVVTDPLPYITNGMVPSAENNSEETNNQETN